MKNTSFMRNRAEGTLHPHQKTCWADQCCLLSSVFSSQKQGVAPSFMEKRGKFRQKRLSAWAHCLSSSYTVHQTSRDGQTGHGRETVSRWNDAVLSTMGNSHHSWCRQEMTRLRKPRTMTAYWFFSFFSFFNIDGLCFCGNKIVCVFGCSYKWQIFLHFMKTSPYLHSESQYPWLCFPSAQGQERTQKGRARKDQRAFWLCFHQRLLYWWFPGCDSVWRTLI